MYSALNVVNELLDVPIREEDIERSHILGKPNDKDNRPILVRFKSYKSNAPVFKPRAKLTKRF